MSGDGLRAVLLALLITFVSACAFGRLPPATWRLPLDYRGDAWAFLAGVKAARDGHVRPLRRIQVPELNAPFGANWNDFPNRQPTLLWISSLLARPFGLFGAVNLVAFAAPVLAGLVFYGVARHLRARWEWAMVGAFAFALSPFYFLRAPTHLSLCLYWHLPWCLLVSAWAYSRRGLVSARRRAWGLGAAVAAGFGNFYYAALFAQLLLGAALAQALRRRARAMAAPLLLASIVVALVGVENSYYLRYRFTHGPNPGAVTRSYQDVEQYALKPLELLLPRPGRGLLGWSAPFAGYWSQALVRGEAGGVYIGLIGAGCLLALLLAPLLAALRRRRIVLSPAFLAAAWILAFSVVGGVNGLLSLVTLPWLRATNRFSIVLLALALLSASLFLSRVPSLRAKAARRLVALGLATFAAADHMSGAGAPLLGPRRTRGPVEDEAFTKAMEAALPQGAMLFMLPVQPFPEWPRQHLMSDYEHFRPYFFATRLRFSYGTDRGRPRDNWQAATGAMPPEAMVRSLERYGFSALVINRHGFEDEGQELLAGLEAAGRPPTVAMHDLVLVPLQPSPRPELPAPNARSPEEPPADRLGET